MGIGSAFGALAHAALASRTGYLKGKAAGEAELRRRALEDAERDSAAEDRTVRRREAEERIRQQAQQTALDATRVKLTEAQTAAASAAAAENTAQAGYYNRRPGVTPTRQGRPAMAKPHDALADQVRNETARRNFIAKRVSELTHPDRLMGNPMMSSADALRQAQREADDVYGQPLPSASPGVPDAKAATASAPGAGAGAGTGARMGGAEADYAEAARLYQQARARNVPGAKEAYDAAILGISRKYGLAR